ncbi:hypothetical protein [Actinoplanes rectilineatus]|uniref:hypothetical protein n=1 Tax=Actinoplanes rectilineatus TaxID=113571 RepID=UPI000AB212EC|nr:hypothetical protein [Actinoplanes rectilineatus]
MADFRITFSIERRLPDESSYSEVGFGTSASASTVDDAAYQLLSAVQNGEWETGPGMPNPSEVEDA